MRRSAREVGGTILVVDDDATESSALAEWLASQRYGSVALGSYQEAHAVMNANIPIAALVGPLALTSGSFFDLVREARARNPSTVIVGYSDINVRPPPELDACFIRPIDLTVLGPFLAVRFGRRPSGEHPRVVADRSQSVPAANPKASRAR